MAGTIGLYGMGYPYLDLLGVTVGGAVSYLGYQVLVHLVLRLVCWICWVSWVDTFGIEFATWISWMILPFGLWLLFASISS